MTQITEFTDDEFDSSCQELHDELTANEPLVTELLKRVRKMSSFQNFGSRQHYSIIQANPIAGVLLRPEDLWLSLLAAIVIGIKIGRKQQLAEFIENSFSDNNNDNNKEPLK